MSNTLSTSGTGSPASTTKEVCFHRRNGLGTMSAIEEAVAVAQMLSCFIGERTDLSGFQDTDKCAPVFGLSVVLDAIAHTVDEAAHVLSAELQHYRAFSADVPSSPEHAFIDESDRKAWRDGYREGLRRAAPAEKAAGGEHAETYPKVSPSLSARDAAIAATVQAGYGLEDIARAVNLKRQTVEKIVARLRGDCAIPPDTSDDLDRAVNE